jgi:hypothetical protein
MGRVRDRNRCRDHSVAAITLVSEEFLLISEAVARLEAGMFGGATKRPKPVEAAKKVDPRASIGLGPHKEKAAAAVNAAIVAGDLTVYVFTPTSPDRVSRSLQLPLDVLNRLLRVRGGLPDHAIRPPASLLRDTSVTPELFAALSNSAMFLQRGEFKTWYQQQKSRRRWHSQRESSKPRTGRPTKQTNELRTSIMALVAEKKWSGPDGIAKLEKLLASKGAPRRNTLRRAVDSLFEETGDPLYRIIPRKRAKAKTST